MQIDAFVKGSRETCFGIIFRDHRGELLATTTNFLVETMPSDVPEVLYLRWAIETTKHSSFSYVMFEKDSQKLNLARKKGKHEGSLLLFEDCKYLWEFLLLLCPRSFNRVADMLVSLSFSFHV